MPADTSPLLDAAAALADAVGSVALPLDVAGAAEAREVRRRLVDQLADHLLPRLADRDAPLLVVVGGSTGAGKSTLVNTLVGDEVSRTGVLRPTTTSPVLVHHPDDEAAFLGERVLPSLPRVRGGGGGGGTEPDVLALVASEQVPPGLALLDAPDIDSVSAANRDLARQLLAAADLWLFTTTPSRYADAVPWELLRTAADRGTSLAVVLDRVEWAQRDAVAAHLRTMLDGAGLASAALLVVPDVAPTDGRLPEAAVNDVRQHLAALAGDAAARREVADATLRGALDSVDGRTAQLEAAAQAQLEAAGDLRERADVAHDHALSRVEDAVEDGRVLRGEVLARWQDFVGGGELLRRLETGVGRLRDRVMGLLRPSRPPEQLTAALGDGLVAVLVDAVERAREDTARAWRAGQGSQLLDAVPRSPVVGRARAAVQAWQDIVVGLVRDQGADRRSTARLLALGLNGVAAALMVAVFASTGGLTGAEVGVAGGTSVVAQRLLEAVLGDQAVRQLTAQARAALLVRVREVVDDGRAAHLAAVDELGLDPGLPARLDERRRALAAARAAVGL